MKIIIGSVILLTASLARAALPTFTVDAVCDNGPVGVWAIGAVDISYDNAGMPTGGSVNGICLDGDTPPAVLKSVLPKDGVICFCGPLSGSGRDLFCLARATVTQPSTVGICVRNKVPVFP